jgi:hypothetical protein
MRNNPPAWNVLKPIIITSAAQDGGENNLLSEKKERIYKMQPRAFRSLLCAAAAMSIAALPAIAQSDKWGYDNGMKSSMDWSATQNMALKAVIDQGLGVDDMMAALPLLMDLRDAEHWQMFNADMPSNDFSAKRSSIWHTISDKIGSTKADSLRRLVEPVAEDVSKSYVRSVHIERIDSLLADWDRQSAARIAAYGGTDASNPVTVTTTTVTTTTIPMAPIYVYSVPPMTTSELVHKLEMKVARASTHNPDALIFLDHNRDLNATDLAFVEGLGLKAWD